MTTSNWSDFIYYVALSDVSIMCLFASNQAMEKKKEEEKKEKKLHRLIFGSPWISLKTGPRPGKSLQDYTIIGLRF